MKIDKINTIRSLYFAYGMNTNHDEMSKRCPDSIFLGPAKIVNHKLTFQRVADYAEHKGSILLGALWLISSNDERSLDRLEGYPNFYDKSFMEVSFGDRNMNAMLYQKVERNNFSIPSSYYENCLRTGYKQSNIKIDQINLAIDHARGYEDANAYSR